MPPKKKVEPYWKRASDDLAWNSDRNDENADLYDYKPAAPVYEVSYTGRASTTSFTEHRVPKVDFSSPLAPEMAANGKALNSGSFVVTAATQHDVKELEDLLAAGHDIDEVDEFGQSAMHKAAISGDVDLVKLLIDKGADVKLRDFKGNTPTMLSGSHNQVAVSDVIQHFLFPPHHNHDSATRPSPYGPQSRSPFVQQFCAKRGMASDELVAWSMRKNEAKFTSAPEPQVFLSHVRESDKVRWK